MPIKLHKFGEALGIADPSTFCLKVALSGERLAQSEDAVVHLAQRRYRDAEDDGDQRQNHHHDHVPDRAMRDRSSMGRDRTVRPVTAGSLSADVPDRLEAERFDQLLKVGGVRIERIVSTGQTTPPGKWFDQAWDEWVLLVSGAAEIQLSEEDTPRPLKPSDYLFIPAHVRHRVIWTTPDQPTIWLAIHIERPVREAAS